MSGERSQNLRKLQNHLNQQNNWTENVLVHQQNAKKNLKSRSRKQNISEESLSFQKQLVRGHWRDFQKNYEKCFNPISGKYILASESSKKNSPSKTENQLIFFQQIKSNPFFDEINSQQFILDLERENKLVEFLTLIGGRLQHALAQEMTFIAFQVWELYLGFKSDILEEQEFFRLAKKAAQKFYATTFQQLEMKTLTSSATSPGLLQEFMITYCIRILAIIEGYFSQSFSESHDNPE